MAHRVFGGKNSIIEKKKGSCIVLNLGQGDRERTSRKTGKIVTLYHRELSQKRASLVVFCSQTGIQGLSTSRSGLVYVRTYRK